MNEYTRENNRREMKSTQKQNGGRRSDHRLAMDKIPIRRKNVK